MKVVIFVLSMLLSCNILSKEIIAVTIGAPAGGLFDTIIRLVLKTISQENDVHVITYNKPGGEGIVAMNSIAGEPDKLLFNGIPLFFKSAEDEKNDKMATSLVPVIQLMNFGTTFISNSPEIRSWKDLMDVSQRRSINIAASSIIQIRMMEKLFAGNKNTNIVLLVGDVATYTLLLSKNAEVVNVSNVFAISRLNSNPDIVALATTTGKIPGVPVLKDQIKTMKEFDWFWGMLFASPNTSYEKIEYYNKIFSKALKNKEVINFYTKNLIDVPENTSQKYANDVFRALLNDIKLEKK